MIMTSNCHHGSPDSISREAKFILFSLYKIGVEVMSADYSRMREIEGVRMMELVYVGGLLKMGGDSLLLPLWRSVGGGFTVKGGSEV